MTNKQRLDKTIENWQKRWRGEGHLVSDSCPLCDGVPCNNCLLGQFEDEPDCRRFVASLGLGLMGYTDPEETLRHLLQLRLYLYGNVKKWIR